MLITYFILHHFFRLQLNWRYFQNQFQALIMTKWPFSAQVLNTHNALRLRKSWTNNEN
jgi:hypothetical protein